MWTLHRTVKQTLGQGGDVLCHQDLSSLILRLFSHFDVLPPLLHIGAIDFQCSITSHFFNSQSWDIATPLPWATSDLSVSGETSWHVMTRDDTCPDKVTRTVRTAMWVQMSDWVIYCLVKVNPLQRAACQAPSAFSLSCSACSELRERGRYLLSDGSNMTSSFALWSI